MFEKSPAHLLTEQEVRGVLERAIQMDAQRADAMTVEQLRDVAREAGISETSLHAAVNDLLAARAPAMRATEPVAGTRGFKEKLLRWPRGVFLGLSAAALGVMTALVNRNVTSANLNDELVALLLVVASLIIALDRRRQRSLLNFQLDIHALWIGFIAAWSATHGAGSAGHVDDLSLLWIAAALLGSVMVAARGRFAALHLQRNP